MHADSQQRENGGDGGIYCCKEIMYDTVDQEKLLDYLEPLNLRGQLGAYLEELYRGLECEVRVSEVLRDPFEVTMGLRQGCVLSLMEALVEPALMYIYRL